MDIKVKLVMNRDSEICHDWGDCCDEACSYLSAELLE